MRICAINPLYILRNGEDVILLNPKTRQWYLTTPEGEKIYQTACAHGIANAVAVSNNTEEDIRDYLDDLLQTLNTPLPASTPRRGSSIYITNACNMRCVHCRFACEKSSFKLSRETIQRYINIEHARGSRLLTITGGEPLLEWNTVQWSLEYATSLGMTTNLLTNGSLITEEIAYTLARLQTSVQISVDSTRSDRFLRFRKYRLEPVVRGIDLLVTKQIPLSLSCSLTRMAIEEIDEVIAFVQIHGIKELHFPMLERGGRATKSWDKLALGDDELISFFAQLLDRYFKEGLRERVRLVDIEMMLEQTLHPPATNHCNLLNGVSALYEDGRVYGCTNLCGDERFCIGEPSDGIEMQTMEQKLRSTLPDTEQIDPCRTCDVQFVCLGGCRDRVMLANQGDMKKEDPYCHVFQYLFRRLLFEQARIQEQLNT